MDVGGALLRRCVVRGRLRLGCGRLRVGRSALSRGRLGGGRVGAGPRVGRTASAAGASPLSASAASRFFSLRTYAAFALARAMRSVLPSAISAS